MVLQTKRLILRPWKETDAESLYEYAKSPEAATELLRRGFEDLNMTTIWCGYYDGNSKSKRVQEKIGFIFHHTCEDVPVPLMNEIRVGHTNYMTKAHWMEIQEQAGKE